MTTPAHSIINYALFKKINPKADNFALWIIIGGLIPDAITTVYAIITMSMGFDFDFIWDTFYYSEPFFSIISLTHSLPFYAALIAITLLVYRYLLPKAQWLIGLTLLWASALLHSFIDFFLHVEDAYRHFFPLTNWRFISPISYWDPNHYGNYFVVFETILYCGVLYWILKTNGWKGRSFMYKFGIVICILWAIALVAQSILFNFFFPG